VRLSCSRSDLGCSFDVHVNLAMVSFGVPFLLLFEFLISPRSVRDKLNLAPRRRHPFGK